MPVPVLPADEEWPRAFAREAVVLREHLAPWLVDGVHHIGSTAVPGLATKPVLDMLAGVRDLDESRAALPVLARLGYVHADHRPDEALWFSRDVGGVRSCQLHLTVPGSRLWRERFAFRDALRADDGLRDEYQALKRSLGRESEGLLDYTQGKRAFVARVLRGQGIALG